MNILPLLMGFLFVITTLFHGISLNTIEKNMYERIDLAAKTSVRGALVDTNWDLEATANAGYIILDHDKVEADAQNIFNTNQDILNESIIIVVNDAPITLNYLGHSHPFDTNGVAIFYDVNDRLFMRVAEVTDY